MSQLQVRLYRDSFNTPWGFRLQGGKDLGQPLSIQRVFSNSPAEGELQRGDLILSINNRDGTELTHKQALDLIKHGGGQIQLVIQRPAPGRVQSTASVTIKPQRPRAPSLQVEKLREHETPATEAFIKNRLERLQRIMNEEMLYLNIDLSAVYPEMPSSPRGQPTSPQLQQRQSNPCYNPHFPPPSPSNPPPWAAQNFAPKKVSKLSRLGGGGTDYGVDYGAKYGTVPRRRHSTQVSSSMTNLSNIRSNPPKVVSLSRLGGGGYEFGTNYCTLPRKTQRQQSQPPSSSMPATGYGFQPKKVTLSSLGGGGPEFGSDYSGYRPSVTQPVQVHTGGRAPPGHNADMLNRVQESLDNISLSPRTPDYYQASPFSPTSPGGGGGYISTGARLDMEREAEERRRQQHQQHQQQQQQQYQQQPSLSYEPPPPSAYYEPRPTGYVPTAVRLEQQKGEEDLDETGQPVKERRRQFLNAPRPAPALSGKSSAPRVLKPKSGSSGFTFGVDYSKPQPKTSSVTWKPQAAQRPVNVPPPQYQPTTPVQQAPPTTWSHEDDQQPQAPPAWRTSLKTTGVKPWDKDVEYTAGQQQAPRSVAFQPPAAAPAAAPFSPVPLTPGGDVGGGPQQDGPQVVHLQYNSPMGLYSRENVQETFSGQTKAMVAGGPPSSGGPPVQNPAKPGDRDWTQSAVYRMIYEEEHKGPRSAPQQQQQHQPAAPQQPQYKAPPPAAPKPQQPTFQQSFQPLEDEFGTSDF